MATMNHDWLSLLRFGPKPKPVKDSHVAREFANRAYKAAGSGPTPKMKRFYAELLDNERRSKADG